MKEGLIYFARQQGVVIMKFIGDIRIGHSHGVTTAFDKFLDSIFEKKDFENILFDLTEMDNIDSTNLGLLARAADYTQLEFGRKPTIVSTNENIDEILDSVGFDQVFVIIHDPQRAIEELQQLAADSNPDKDFARMVLEAHKALCAINEQNQAMFKNVVEVFEKELKNGDMPEPA